MTRALCAPDTRLSETGQSPIPPPPHCQCLHYGNASVGFDLERNALRTRVCRLTEEEFLDTLRSKPYEIVRGIVHLLFNSAACVTDGPTNIELALQFRASFLLNVVSPVAPRPLRHALLFSKQRFDPQVSRQSQGSIAEVECSDNVLGDGAAPHPEGLLVSSLANANGDTGCTTNEATLGELRLTK